MARRRYDGSPYPPRKLPDPPFFRTAAAARNLPNFSSSDSTDSDEGDPDLYTERSDSPDRTIVSGWVKYRDNRKWKSGWGIFARLSPSSSGPNVNLFENLRSMMSQTWISAADAGPFHGIPTGGKLCTCRQNCVRIAARNRDARVGQNNCCIRINQANPFTFCGCFGVENTEPPQFIPICKFCNLPPPPPYPGRLPLYSGRQLVTCNPHSPVVCMEPLQAQLSYPNCNTGNRLRYHDLKTSPLGGVRRKVKHPLSHVSPKRPSDRRWGEIGPSTSRGIQSYPNGLNYPNGSNCLSGPNYPNDPNHVHHPNVPNQHIYTNYPNPPNNANQAIYSNHSNCPSYANNPNCPSLPIYSRAPTPLPSEVQQRFFRFLSASNPNLIKPSSGAAMLHANVYERRNFLDATDNLKRFPSDDLRRQLRSNSADFSYKIFEDFTCQCSMSEEEAVVPPSREPRSSSRSKPVDSIYSLTAKFNRMTNMGRPRRRASHSPSTSGNSESSYSLSSHSREMPAAPRSRYDGFYGGRNFPKSYK